MSQDLVLSLQKQNRILKQFMGLGCLTLTVTLLVAAKSPNRKHHFTEINVERINIVRPDGKTEMVLANRLRLPKAIMDGKEVEDDRRKPGLIFYNEAGDAEEALLHCAEHKPDIAFLDIRLPGMSGLKLAPRLPKGIHIVFVTAYDAHAIQAFEAGAVDYLLKPITPERLQKTMDRVRDRAMMSVPGSASAPMHASIPMEAMLQHLAGLIPSQPSPKPEPEYLQWITATSGKRTHWIAVEDVIFFQSDHKYTRVVCQDGAFIVDTPIKDLAERLDPKRFQQVHRSSIVNLREIAWVEKQDGGTAVLHLRGHAECLSVSERGYRALKERG